MQILLHFFCFFSKISLEVVAFDLKKLCKKTETLTANLRSPKFGMSSVIYSMDIENFHHKAATLRSCSRFLDTDP